MVTSKSIITNAFVVVVSRVVNIEEVLHPLLVVSLEHQNLVRDRLIYRHFRREIIQLVEVCLVVMRDSGSLELVDLYPREEKLVTVVVKRGLHNGRSDFLQYIHRVFGKGLFHGFFVIPVAFDNGRCCCSEFGFRHDLHLSIDFVSYRVAGRLPESRFLNKESAWPQGGGVDGDLVGRYRPDCCASSTGSGRKFSGVGYWACSRS